MAVRNRDEPGIVKLADFDPGGISPGQIVIVEDAGSRMIYMGTGAGRAVRLATHDELGAAVNSACIDMHGGADALPAAKEAREAAADAQSAARKARSFAAEARSAAERALASNAAALSAAAETRKAQESINAALEGMKAAFEA